MALAFLASPIVIIAGTQTADFVWATVLRVGGAGATRPPAAGRGAARATIGSRSSSLLLIVALLAAVAWDPRGRRRCLRAAAVLVPGALLLYVPAWLSFDRTFGFLTATDGWYGLANNLGRFVVKNYAVGGVALAAMAVALPAFVRSLGRWNDDPMLRFAVLGLVATEALFLRGAVETHPPGAVPHDAVAVGGGQRPQPAPVPWVVVGAMAINGLVVFRPFIADVPNSTRGADPEPAVTVGWLLNEIDCRTEYMHEPPRLAPGAGLHARAHAGHARRRHRHPRVTACRSPRRQGVEAVGLEAGPTIRRPTDAASAASRVTASATSAVTSSVWARPGNMTS